ncbi:hypothetical protein Tco_1560369 [Tanacetum coccineum]
MTKVIKAEFEKLEDLNDEDVSLTCVEVANIPCDSNKDDDSKKRVSHEADDDMGYDPSDVAFTEWLGLKIFNYKTMDHYTKKALWIYWIRGDDELSSQMKSFLIMKIKLLKSLGSTLIYLILRHLCARPLNNLTIFCKSIQTYLLRTLKDSRPMKITRMIRFMNRTKTYHGSTRSQGLTLEFGPNPHQLNILVSLSTIKLDVRNGQWFFP